MNKLKRIREIRAGLESLIHEDLLVAVQDQRVHSFNTLEEILQRIKTRSLAINNGSKLLPLISEELRDIRKVLDAKKDSNLADTYLHAVKKHTIDLADEITVSQDEDRFKSLETDSAGVKLAKFFKRWVRSIGTFWHGLSNFLRKSLDKPTKAYGSRTQKIPLQRLAEFHLCKHEAILEKWIDEDHQLLASIIQELDQFLGENISDNKFCRENKSHADSFSRLTEQQLGKVRNERSSMEEQLRKDFETIQHDLFYYLERAGTLERRAGFYQASKVEQKSSRFRSRLLNYLEHWNETNLLLLGKTQTVEEFLDFKKELEEKSLEFLDTLESFFEAHLFAPFQSLQRDLAAIQNKLREFEKQQKYEAANNLIVDSNSLLKKLVQEVRTELDSVIKETELSLKANQFAEHALLKANDISEHRLFIHDMELEKKPPSLDHKIIEWRLLVVRVLKEQIFNQLLPSKQHYEDFLVQIDNDLAEASDIIEVNLESATELLESRESESSPFEIAIEALERTQSKLETAHKITKEKHETLKLAVLEGGDEFCNKMLHLIRSGDLKELQILDAKYKVKEKTQSWQTKAGARWARMQDSFTLFRRFGWKKTKEYVAIIRKFVGFEKQEAEQVVKADVAAYLSETDAKIKELPYIYRRLFNFDMEADRRFYITLTENFGNLKKAYESWENDFPATFAVVGERGSGKSTYFNYAIEDYFQGKEVKQIIMSGGYYSEVDFIEFMKEQLDMDDIGSVESIISALQNSRKKRVIIIKELQNFYLRHINGYGALESLLYVISETKDTVFWMVSCSLYAWNFMDKTVSVQQYFSHVIRTDTLNKEQIESVIMNRHRSSGYELVFEPGQAQSRSRAYRKLMDREEEAREYLREAYFEDLTKLSEGNASIAMIFWIRSIREFDDTHFYIKPLEVTSLELIQELKPGVLFTLAAIILHDTVTPEELCRVLLFTEQESRLMLIRLKTRGLLQQNGDRYFVNQLMYRQIVRVLKERNIIHLV